MKRITDLGLMTVIDIKGIDYDDIDVSNGQVALIYKNEEEVNKIIKDYYNNNLQVDARTLISALNDMKTMISQIK